MLVKLRYAPALNKRATQGVALARAHAIPIGLHRTLTCEWDHLRWRPLTGGASLVQEDGTMHRTVEEARAMVDPEEAYS